MISFVDISTGNVFDGKEKVFWFDGEQSINLIYTQKICFIAKKRQISVSIPENEVFTLLDASKIDSPSIDYNQLKTNKLQSVGTPYRNFYVHMIYVGASSTKEGEVICDLIIAGDNYKVGADFYMENESLYVNLSNNGISIPNSIQKAIWDANIYESNRDNILMNRKWKELLSNMWELVCNKGSYKSLINTLNWFEWGSLIDINEFWKREDNVLEMTKLMDNTYNNELHNLKKTTYISLTAALDKIVPGEYDDEKNPLLDHIASKWSNEELSLKISILGNFYKTYFMPIHLDLLHATIENTVYTNTFKAVHSSSAGRYDYVYNVNDLVCEVSQNNFLDYVEAYVGPNTMFGSKWQEGMERVDIVGVDKKPIVFNIIQKPSKEHRYALTQTKEVPLTPDKITDLWTTQLYPVTREYPYSWECFRTLNEVTGEYGDWSTPVIVDIWESDVDPILEYRYKLTQNNVIPVDANWSVEPLTTTSTYPYEWISFRVLDIATNTWSEWSDPVLSSIYNSSPSNIEYQYALGDSNGPKNTWVYTPQTTTSSLPYEWMRFRVLDINGNWSEWGDNIIASIYNSTPNNIEYQYTKTKTTIPTEDNWYAEEPTLDITNMYGWTRFRVLDNGVWGEWSDPVLTSIYKEVEEKPYAINYAAEDPVVVSDTISDDDIKTFASQYFKSIGSIVDFKLKPVLEDGDYIKRETIVVKYPDGTSKTVNEYKVLTKDIEFSLLFKHVGDYEVRIELECASGYRLNKVVKFPIEDLPDVDLKIYKIINNRTPDFTQLNKPHKINNYTFSRLIDETPNMLLKQYIPATIVDPRKLDGDGWRGICLNHCFILEGKWEDGDNHYIDNHYVKMYKETKNNTYTICISKRFGFEPKDVWVRDFRSSVYRDDYIFMPEFHTLYELGYERFLTTKDKEDIKYYTVTDEDALCVVPSLPISYKVDSYVWEFVNESTGKTIKMEPIREPFITNNGKFLDPGYYTVVFRYNVGGTTREIKINSAFRKV